MMQIPATRRVFKSDWANRAAELVETAARANDLPKGEVFYGDGRSKGGKARAHIIRQLDQDGCSYLAIGRIFNLHPTTVLYHLGRAKSWQRGGARA